MNSTFCRGFALRNSRVENQDWEKESCIAKRYTSFDKFHLDCKRGLSKVWSTNIITVVKWESDYTERILKGLKGRVYFFSCSANVAAYDGGGLMTMLRFHCRSSFLDSLRVTPLSSSRSRRIVSILAICQCQQTIKSLETAARWTLIAWQDLSSCHPYPEQGRKMTPMMPLVWIILLHHLQVGLSLYEIPIHASKELEFSSSLPPKDYSILSKVKDLNRCKLFSHMVGWKHPVHPSTPLW